MQDIILQEDNKMQFSSDEETPSQDNSNSLFTFDSGHTLDDMENVNSGSDGDWELKPGEIDYTQGCIQRETLLHVPRKVWVRFERLIEEDTEETIAEITAKDDAAEEILLHTDKCFVWTDDFSQFKGKREIFKLTPGPTVINNSPYESFCAIWDRQIMATIAAETNNYAQQTITSSTVANAKRHYEKWYETDADEIYMFFVIYIIMTCPIEDDELWTGNSLKRYIPNLMKHERFVLLKHFLHFVDNSTLSELRGENLKVAKLGPIVDHCNKRFESLYTPQQNIAIQESISLFRGESLHKYLESKATGEDRRTYELCDSSNGYVWRIIMHPARNTDELIFNASTATTNIVLKLTEGIRDRGHTLFMDNCYNSPLLARYLKQEGTDVVGTLRSTRIHTPQQIKDLDKMRNRQRKENKGQHLSRHCGVLSINSWVGKKHMHIISTYHDDFSSLGKTGAHTRMPKQAEYMPMDGVDERDDILSDFDALPSTTRKWYMQAFMRLLNVSIWNAYIIHQRKSTLSRDENKQHFKFRKELVHGLMENHISDDARILVGEALQLSSGMQK